MTTVSPPPISRYVLYQTCSSDATDLFRGGVHGGSITFNNQRYNTSAQEQRVAVGDPAPCGELSNLLAVNRRLGLKVEIIEGDADPDGRHLLRTGNVKIHREGPRREDFRIDQTPGRLIFVAVK